MSLFSFPEITNFKFHFKLSSSNTNSLNFILKLYHQTTEDAKQHLDQFWEVKQSNNFNVLRPKKGIKSQQLIESKLVFICFGSGHVNVTGVRGKDLILECILLFTNFFEFDSGFAIQSYQIDNFCARAVCTSDIARQQIEKHLDKFLTYVGIWEAGEFSANYNPLLFTGLFLKIHHWETSCTVNLFKSGRCCLVGLKSTCQLKRASELLSEVVFRWIKHLQQD